MFGLDISYTSIYLAWLAKFCSSAPRSALQGHTQRGLQARARWAPWPPASCRAASAKETDSKDPLTATRRGLLTEKTLSKTLRNLTGRDLIRHLTANRSPAVGRPQEPRWGGGLLYLAAHSSPQMLTRTRTHRLILNSESTFS